MARHLAPPPSDVTGPIGRWLRDLHTYIEGQPSISLASFAPTETPNSRVTGTLGNLCVNLGSASTISRLWILGGGTDASARTDQGWFLVQTRTP